MRQRVSLKGPGDSARRANKPRRGKVGEKSGPVLLVEHDDVQREGLGRILRGEGHEVLEASHPDDAVALALAFDPDVVVVGDGPLGIQGQQVLTALANDLAEGGPPTVLLTASEATAEMRRRAGALGLSKPFRVEDLLTAVQRFQRARKPDA